MINSVLLTRISRSLQVNQTLEALVLTQQYSCLATKLRSQMCPKRCDACVIGPYVKGNIDRTPPTFARHETSLQTGSKHPNHRPQPRNPQEHDEMVSFLPFRTLHMVPWKSGVSFQRDESVGRDGCGRMSLDGVFGVMVKARRWQRIRRWIYGWA